MVISNPTLPPRRGYVEVDVNGRRTYRNADTGVLMEDETHGTELTVWDELDAAYQEGVNTAYDQ